MGVCEGSMHMNSRGCVCVLGGGGVCGVLGEE